jgi:hypothetical protein
VLTAMLESDESFYLTPVFIKKTNSVSAWTLNDSGIVQGGIDNNGINRDCTGTDIELQDCFHGRDATDNNNGDGKAGFSFLKLGISGKKLSPAADTWSCVKDKVTGRVWEVKTNDGGIHDFKNVYRWGGKGADQYGNQFYNDWNALLNASNGGALCGYRDWRLPTRKELESIIDFGATQPAIDEDYFPWTIHYSGGSRYYWTTSVFAGDEGDAWSIYFWDGSSHEAGRSSSLAVRLVRGGQ